MKDAILELRRRLTELAQGGGACGLLFSGGLDSSILAAINPDVRAITVNLKSHGEDIEYSASVAKFLNMKHYQKSISIDEAMEAIPEAIRMLGTFDPAIPNDLTVYFGLKLAKELGMDEVMTGDGADELFAGYSFMLEIDDLENYIEKMMRKAVFNSSRIAKFFGIKIKQPFLDRSFIDFSLGISPDLKIREHGGSRRGKWILRRAFEGVLPEDILWQGKRPLEYGSGMGELRGIISDRITDKEFKENPYPVKFMNKEHFYYYKVYRNVVGQIPKPEKGQDACPGCGAGMERDAFHCGICGHVRDWRK